MNAAFVPQWTPYPSVILGLTVWTAAYVWVTGPLRRGRGWGAGPRIQQQVAFHAGTLICLLALISPLDSLADEYLFSAHMVQHLLLLFVVAPLWLVGMPDWMAPTVLGRRLLPLARRLTRPVAAAVIFGGVMLAWHHPRLYEMAKGIEWVHVVEHLSYLGAGLVGWWPIVGSASKALPRPGAPVRILYDFSIALPCTLLGAVFTFASQPIYAATTGAYGLGPLDDQRLAGLLMWIPTHMLLLAIVFGTAARWLGGATGKPQMARS